MERRKLEEPHVTVLHEHRRPSTPDERREIDDMLIALYALYETEAEVRERFSAWCRERGL